MSGGRPVPIYLRPRHGRTPSVIARGLAGRTVFGPEKTNARWGRHGTGPVDDRAGWWAHQSYRRRSGLRLLVIFGPLAVIYGLFVNPEGTARLLREAGLVALLMGFMAMIHWTRRWSHYKTWIVAVALVAGGLLAVSRHRRPRDWVHIPVGHREDPDKPVVLDLPDNFSWPQTRRDKLAKTVAATAGIQHADWEFDDEARPYPTLTVRSLPQPPDLVKFEDMIPHYETCALDAVVWGKTTGAAPYSTSLSSDSPHVLCSIGPGGGKTEFCCGLALQFLRRPRPTRIVYFDIIKHGASAKWAKDIDGIDVIVDVNDAHDLILELYAEVQRRCKGYYLYGYNPDEPLILIIMDEANRSYKELQRYWARVLGGVRTSPAIDAYEGILFVGREASAVCCTVGQRGSAAGTGGGDSREAYGVIAANRYSLRTSRMLFADVGDGTKASMPVSSNKQGRIQVVTGGVATLVQTPLCIDRNTKELLPAARAWLETAPLGATAGSAAGDPMTRYAPTLGITTGSDPGSGHRGGHLHSVPNAPEDDLPEPDEAVEATLMVSLGDAAERLPGDTKAIKTALENDRRRKVPGFPGPRHQVGRTKLYDFDEVRAYWSERPGAAGGAS